MGSTAGLRDDFHQAPGSPPFYSEAVSFTCPILYLMKSGLEAWGQQASFCDRNYCGKPFWLKSQEELMLSANSNGHCLARTDFSLHNHLCLGSADHVEIPRLLGGLTQGGCRGWSLLRFKGVPRPGRLRMEIHQLSCLSGMNPCRKAGLPNLSRSLSR